MILRSELPTVIAILRCVFGGIASGHIGEIRRREGDRCILVWSSSALVSSEFNFPRTLLSGIEQGGGRITDLHVRVVRPAFGSMRRSVCNRLRGRLRRQSLEAPYSPDNTAAIITFPRGAP
jgi:hypothetical protein